MAFARRNAAISCLVYPTARRTSSVCSPRRGGGDDTKGSAPDNLKPARVSVRGRSSAGNVKEGLQQFPLHDLGIVQCFRDRYDPAGGDSQPIEHRFPLCGGFVPQRCLELGGQRGAIFLSTLSIGEARVGGEPAGADRLRERLELLLLVGGDIEQPVPGLERAGGCRREVVVPHRGRRMAGDEKVRDDPTHRREGAIEHRNVDERALAGGAAADQRARHGECSGNSSDRVGDRITDAKRCAVLVAGDAHDARQALDDLVVRGRVLQRAFLPVPGDRAVDQRRIDLGELLVSQPEATHHAGPEVLDQHVGVADEPSQDVATAIRLQIDRDRLLAAVLCQERRTHQLLVQRRIGAKLARKVPRFGKLQLDDLRAEQAELIGTERSGEDIGEIEHAHARERALRPYQSERPARLPGGRQRFAREAGRRRGQAVGGRRLRALALRRLDRSDPRSCLHRQRRMNGLGTSTSLEIQTHFV